MVQSTISDRLDSNDKAAINITLSEAPFYNKENQTYILKSVTELHNGKGTKHELIEEE